MERARCHLLQVRRRAFGNTRLGEAVLSLSYAGHMSDDIVAPEELLTISVTPMRMVFWSGFWSFWITIVMVALNEGLEAPRHLMNAKAEAKNAFLCSILAAVCLNIVQCVAVEQLGPLMQSIVGNLNLILVIALSQASSSLLACIEASRRGCGNRRALCEFRGKTLKWLEQEVWALTLIWPCE